MKVWKVSYDCKNLIYTSNISEAKLMTATYARKLFGKIKAYTDSEKYVDTSDGSTKIITTEEIRKEILDFAEFGLPEEVEIEEVK